MHLATHLIAFGLRQTLGESADGILDAVQRRFTDHSQALPEALARANDRAWQALAVALTGDGWLDSIKVFFTASSDDKGFREEVRLLLDGKPFPFEGTPADLRRACLAELKQARKDKLLSADGVDAFAVARQAADLRRYDNPQGLIDGACQAVVRVADELAPRFPNLAHLLRQRPANGPPLLAAAFAFFFRREVETNAELARGLTFDALRQLAASQETALGEVEQALATLGSRFDARLDEVLAQLDRIERTAAQARDAAHAAHGATLDLHVELQRLGGLHLTNGAEVRHLVEQVLSRLDQAGMRQGEVRAQHSFSIRSEDERRAVKQLLARFRELPADEQHQAHALLNGLGKLQVGAGDFGEARQTFVEVAGAVRDKEAQAEACHNAYRAALEERKLDEALAALLKAAELSTQRFAPFPLHRYRPRRILGAGGFGAAFHCDDSHFDEEVVVKSLHAADLNRGVDEVFREARLLRRLSHPAIIGVRDCDYADSGTKARPYIVMDYFPGGTLEAFVRERGTVAPADMVRLAREIAGAMRAAHESGVLHRDLKPENVLVRKEGERWRVKVIDFGLALRHQTVETSMARATGENTVLGSSVAGTVKYAPPEQMGQVFDGQGRRVLVGPYSDVYSFGKLCCHALFKTTEPRTRHFGTVSVGLSELLEQCIEQELEHRLADFGAVLTALEAADPEKAEQERRADEARRQEEIERQRREQEEAKRLRETDPSKKELRPGEVVTSVLGMKFAWCPPGTFLMGSSTSEEERENNEVQHRVTLTQGFLMGVTPVTQAQWQAVMGSNPSQFNGDDRPVENVSWEDCQDYCQKLGVKTDKRFRLPTEAEWEYACRAGTTTPFHFGDTINTDLANYDGTYTYGNGVEGPYREQTTPVGSFPANAWGLYDMHGNVWEWCQDRYGPYPDGDIKDPTGGNTGVARVLRGGSWFGSPDGCRAAYRLKSAPALRYGGYGCRLVLCLD